MRARGGGVLSASALVAVGTSLLLAALIGLGISDLSDAQSSAHSGAIHSEAAAVVVPGGDEHHRTAPTHTRRSPAASSQAWSAPQQVAPVTVTSGSTEGSRSAATTEPTASSTVRRAGASSSPTPSPTPTRGNGKAKGAGNGNGHHKP